MIVLPFFSVAFRRHGSIFRLFLRGYEFLREVMSLIPKHIPFNTCKKMFTCLYTHLLLSFTGATGTTTYELASEMKCARNSFLSTCSWYNLLSFGHSRKFLHPYVMSLLSCEGRLRCNRLRNAQELGGTGRVDFRLRHRN